MVTLGENEIVNNSIVDAIQRNAREQPDATAFTFLADGRENEQSLTFAEVEERSQAIASELRHTAPRAERVMILQPPGLDFIISLCACFLAGVAAVPTPPSAARANSNSAQRFARLLADAAPDAIITHSDLLARSRWLVEGQIGLASQTWVLSDNHSMTRGQSDWPDVKPDDLALLQYTSGSTAEPKGVRISHGNLAANLTAIQEKFELTRESIGVSWLPPYHDMGLIGGVISALWCGYQIVLMDPKHFIARPLSWLETIDRFRADVSGGANFAFDLCADAVSRGDRATFDLSRWRLAFSGAEPVRAKTIERFTDAFASHGFRRAAFYPCYGLAEATLMAAGPTPGAERPIITHTDDGRALVSCGSPCEGLVIEIADANTGEPLADGEEGEIRISGSSVSPGYWRDDLSPNPKPLATGDLGFLLQGDLYVTGRLKDLIIVRGRNIAPSDIEDAIAICHPALAPAASAAFSVEVNDVESFVVAAEIRREHRRNTNWPEVFAAMRNRISEQVGLTPIDMVLLRPGTLARTTSGKIRRQACRQTYLDDTWNPLAQVGDLPATMEGVFDQSRRMANAGHDERWAALDDYLVWRLSQLTSTPEAFLTPGTAIDSVGLDSLKQVEFALNIERDLGVALSTDWLETGPTISALARVLTNIRQQRTSLEQDADCHGVPVSNETIAMTPRQAAFFDGTPDRQELFAEVLYFRTPKGASVDNLKQAIADTVDLHDAFSICFARNEINFFISQKEGSPDIEFQRIDITGLEKGELSGVRADILKQIYRSFSLEQGRLISAVFLDQGASRQGMLAIGFHHLVIDAVSLSAWVVRFENAYKNVISGQGIRFDSPRPGGYVPWLRALDAYGLSPELADELEYWKENCGIGEDVSSVTASRPTAAWKSTGKTTLTADANQQLLERYRAPIARNAMVLAALSRAWVEVTGDDAPLVMVENHGRHPFPGTDPSTDVGWFAVRHPISVPVQKVSDASDLTDDAIARLRAVPKLGHGYALLRRKNPDDPHHAEMEKLRKPSVFLQYRGNIDETFRADATLPVIAVHHEGRAFDESSRNLGDVQPIAVMAGMSDGVFYWSVFFDAPDIEDTAQALSVGMRRFFTELGSR